MKRMHLAVAGVLGLATISAFAPSARAQGTTTATPFHAGQWGIEGYAAGQSGGIMRFFTPRTALVLTLSGDRLDLSDNAAAAPTSNRATVVDATLGFRRHSMLAQRIASTFGAGLIAGSVTQKIAYGGPAGTSSYHGSYIGAFVDVGGQYMVADHFAVGLAYRFAGQHLKPNGSDQRGTEFQLGFLPIRATLYF